MERPASSVPATDHETNTPTQPTFMDAFLEFSETTSTHCVGNIARTRSHRARMLWLTLFFVNFSILILAGALLQVRKFVSAPIDTIRTVEHNDSFIFPAVTLCNPSPVSVTELVRFLDDEKDNDSIMSNIDKIDYAVFRKMVNRSSTLPEITCIYHSSSEPCEMKSNVVIPDFGVCVTIYPPLEKSRDIVDGKWVRTVGHADSLEIRVQPSLENFFSRKNKHELFRDVGYYVSVHPPDVVPDMCRFSFTAFSTAVEFDVRIVSHYRLAAKRTSTDLCVSYEDLDDTKKRRFLDAYAETQGTKYTSQGCMDTCKQKEALFMCGCAIPQVSVVATRLQV